MDLAEFLLARIAEDEFAAQDSLERGFGGWEWLADLGVNFEARTHIVRWHPARVLAECDAKRRIVQCLAMYEPHIDTNQDEILQLLALPYADHPDYQQEWAP